MGTAIDPTNAAVTPARQRSSQVLDELRSFVHRERDAAQAQLMETWSQPLADKLAKGLSQRLLRLEAGPDAGTVWAYPDRGDSRFREGDLLCLHLDSPFSSVFARAAAFEAEEDGRWLLRLRQPVATVLQDAGHGACYADPDDFDLTKYYEEVLDDIGETIPPSRANRTLLPLLNGQFSNDFDPRDFEEAERAALAEGLNAGQAEAVGKALSAEQVACIQGAGHRQDPGARAGGAPAGRTG